jgi:hypothetical protein
MIRKFTAAVPSQRASQLRWKFADVFTQRTDNTVRIPAANFDQHSETRMALDKRCNVAVTGTRQQVAFPVPWYCAILNLGWALPDPHRINDLARRLTFRSGTLRSRSRFA